ncbi:hypothetical protein FisN_18Lh105 [Fistulifera solaris]|uniref:Vacuolar protein sorting-associated protein 35 n=1 Tax=Fistulifera solaris TaxID=1519565 RepID=A0A1Z5KFE6_FISSO|nr:hypothetical protein FisN_18Lh105 [Fistulifera solaris]|eukprot:GAX24812.1 hypothetical protein FisN_18Lh105 [Fistulifera solaris]
MDPINSASMSGDASSAASQNDNGWSTMGGTPGSGFQGNAASPPPAYYSPSPQQQQQAYGGPGSITRFATPQQQPGMSFAERSAQAYSTSSMPPQPQQLFQQSPSTMQNPQNRISSSQQPVMTPSQPQQNTYPTRPPSINQAPPGSFAARSAQAHSAAGMPSHVYGSGVPYGGTPASYGGGQSVVSSLGGSPPQVSYAQRSTYGQPNPPVLANQQQPYGAQQIPQQVPQPVPSPHGSVAANPPQMPTYVGVKQHPPGMPTPQDQAMQQRMLTEATRKVQEHSYYMRQAMEQNNIPVTLDRAAHMVGELGELPHGQQAASPSASNPSAASSSSGPSNSGLSSKLTPKNYYELYMRALEDMPTFEDFLLNLAQPAEVPAGQIQIVASPLLQRKSPFTLRELYDYVQYCPRVLPRLYLQIAAGSALIRSGEVGAKWVLNDLIQAVRCEQNPIRGLFLRHYLLTALRDKLPGKPVPNDVSSETQISGEEHTEAGASVKTVEIEQIDVLDPGTVKDSYEFVLENFMEMNKLWVRIQHLPGEGNDKDVRKRRERERNDLRILVGTNLVRLSQLENVTSKIYGEVILNQILDHIVVCGDPLSQAYLMDCLVQTFPDEYHIETLPILLSVCPRLRDKVNIRTILQGLMDRLANYLGDEELLDESDTNQVKKELARDSFGMFEECVQNVYNARGPKLTAREVIRLQTALLTFSVRCYPENTEQVARCLGSCVAALRQANASYEMGEGTVIDMPHDKILVKALDEVSVAELEKLLSIPLEKLALKCLRLEHYGDLISFLPWSNRRQVAIALLEAVDNMGTTPESVSELEQLFQVIAPLVRDETTQTPIGAQSQYQMDMTRASNLMANLGVSATQPVPVVHGASIGPEHLKQVQAENALVCKLLHLISDPNTDHVYEQLCVARKHLEGGESYRQSETLVSLVFASLKLARQIFAAENGLDEAKNDVGTEVNKIESEESTASQDRISSEANNADSVAEEDTSGDGKIVVQEGVAERFISGSPVDGSLDKDDASGSKSGVVGGDHSNTSEDRPSADLARSISCRKLFVFMQETLMLLSRSSSQKALKLYLEISLVADAFAKMSDDDAIGYSTIAYEYIVQAFTIYEESIEDQKSQHKLLETFIGTLLSMESLSAEEYEGVITKTAQFAAKLFKKQDQCRVVALCAYLFYPVPGKIKTSYSNPQRALECLQRSLKLADSCTNTNPSHLRLFVELMEHYVFFFENKNPSISPTYISGLAALIKEHLSNNMGSGDLGVVEARDHFMELLRYVKDKKAANDSSELFTQIQLEGIGA